MSYAPETLMDARAFIIATMGVPSASVGIVGDDSHQNAGTSYHLGKDALKKTAYSIIESPRDRNGLSNAASGLDVGEFSKGKNNLQTFSKWLVAQCQAGTDDTRDIREVIYSPDGKTVKRWDRLKKRSTGPIDHTWHTHISYFRDSERRDKTALFRRYAQESGITPPPPPRKITMEQFTAELPVLKQGDTGSMVIRAQLLLDYLTPGTLDKDGDYGPQTAAAVKALNKGVGDGKTIDVTTWQKLYNLGAVKKTGSTVK